MKTFKIAAIIPHGNIQSELQQEQHNFCRKAGIIKAAPFLCILEKLESSSPDDAVLAKYSELFRSFKKAPELSPIQIAHFRAFRNLNDEISLCLSEETFKVGSFLYKPGELLYGTAEIKDKKYRKDTPDSEDASILTELTEQPALLADALPAENAPVHLIVFQVSVFSISTACTANTADSAGDSTTGKPAGANLVRWHAEAAKWIRFKD